MLFQVCLLIALAMTATADENGIVVATKKNWEEVIGGEFTIVKFYAPWCGHCKKMLPAFEASAKKNEGVCKFAKVDATVERSLAKKYKVDGYPQLKVFKLGQEFDHYKGPRTEEGLNEYILENKDVAVKEKRKPAETGPSGVQEGSDVLKGVFDNFDTLIQGDFVIVEFFAPWCGHCKKLAPAFEAAATKLKGKATFVQIDAIEETELAERFEVTGYPTLHVYKSGEKVSDYEGKKTTSGFVDYFNNNEGDAVETVASADAFQSILAENPVVVVALFTTNPNSFAAKVLMDIATVLRSTVKFVFVDPSFEGAGAKDSIVLYKGKHGKNNAEGEVATETYGAGRDVSKEQLSMWIKYMSLPQAGFVTPRTVRTHRARGLPLAWIFDNGTDEASMAVDVVKSVAREYQGKISFVWADPAVWTKMVSIRFATENDENAVFPFFGIENNAEGWKMDLDTDITAENVRNYCDDWLAGALDSVEEVEM